jgi:hypothetical protein
MKRVQAGTHTEDDWRTSIYTTLALDNDCGYGKALRYRFSDNALRSTSDFQVSDRLRIDVW